MARIKKRQKSDPLICLCNGIKKSEIEDAIQRGCTSLSKVFDTTTAGVGPCGGSCQPILKRMLQSYNETGEFPKDPKRPLNWNETGNQSQE